MRVRVTWRPHRDDRADAEDVRLPAGPATVHALLDAVAEPHEGVLAVRDGTPIPLDAPLADGEEILLVRTVSGG